MAMGETMFDAARSFLEHIKRLTEIQATPDLFRGAWLEPDGTRLTFWSGSGQYTMTVRQASGSVHILMLQDNYTYRLWTILRDGSWQESKTGDSGPDFPRDRVSIAQRLIDTVGYRPVIGGTFVARYCPARCQIYD